MEKDRLSREKEQKERAEKEKKARELFSDTRSQWEKDKTEMHNLARKEKSGAKDSSDSKPAAADGQPKDAAAADNKKDAAAGAAKAP